MLNASNCNMNAMSWGKVNTSLKCEKHKSVRKGLDCAISHSKTHCWKLLVEDIDSDPWRLGYKQMIQKLGRVKASSLMDVAVMDSIVLALFSSHPYRAVLDLRYLKIPILSPKKSWNALFSQWGIRNHQAQMKSQVRCWRQSPYCPRLLFNMCNACLSSVFFSVS